ncbi:MAG: hypothetical protein DRP59_12685 [Spirochaetes bacterium]|nr:MAG: hypothetical protein DRP59_12685 [Spirochaetota bacterium]
MATIRKTVYTLCMIRIIDYSVTTVKDISVSSIEKCIPFRNKESVTWIDIESLEDKTIIDSVGSVFSILEHGKVITEQLSIIMGKGYVITFQEKPGDVFDPIRERIRAKKFRINSLESDFLAYSLVDVIIDNYFVILETFGEEIEKLEDILLLNPTKTTLHNIHALKRKVLTVISTIFIPLTFITGLYGMNFKYMPELTWRWGYPLVITVMGLIVAGLILFFRKKKWL